MKSILKALVNASSIPVILSMLERGDTYGYEIIQRMKAYTNEQVVWQEASIYPQLARMEKGGMIKSYWRMSQSDRPRKYYTILADGQKQLEFNKQELQRLNGVFERLWSQA